MATWDITLHPMVLHPSNYYTHKTYTYIQHSWALTTLTYSHTHHVACRCPNVSSNRSSDPSGYLPSPSRGQEPSFAPPSPSPSTCALQCPPSPANPHASNRSPSLTSAVPSSTRVHHSCLPAPSGALSSPFNTLPALQHVSNLHATCHLHPAVPSRYRSPLPSTFSCHQCTHYHHPRAPCRLLPEFHVPLASAESAKHAINWYKIHSVVS
jgi:hypothetical protein